LLLSTVVTSVAIMIALLGVLRVTLEKEITARGESTAVFLAQANGPLLLEKNHSQLQYNLTSLTSDSFIVNALVADHEGTIVASLDKNQIGTKLPSYLRDASQTKWDDPKTNTYHFRAPIRYGEVNLGVFVISLSKLPLHAAIDRVTRWAALLVVGIAAVIAMFSLILVRRELRPLQVMNAAIDAIGKGDFTQRVPIKRNDEIGELADAFNVMVSRTELFFHYVDKMVIERLLADESLARPGGHQSELAVIFGDMRGYTAMSNRRSANEVVRIVNTYFHLFIECIAQFGGIVDKTMGDAIMTVFEPRPGEETNKHRERAVLALAYMKMASRIMNGFLKGRPDIAKRCGLEPREWGFAMAIGPAIVGNIGSRRRMDYTVCGRVVNLASRLEGLTKNGEVIVDNFTRLDTGHLITLEELPPVQPKGFSAAEKVIPHRITSLSEEVMPHAQKFMKRLFSYGFVKDMLMPADLPADEQHMWCDTNHRFFERLIDKTPVQYFFARADAETGQIMIDQDLRHATGELLAPMVHEPIQIDPDP
jgi:class 3 adenylate cyclase